LSSGCWVAPVGIFAVPSKGAIGSNGPIVVTRRSYPEVVIDGDLVRIGEDANTAILKRDEWNVLVELIQSGQLGRTCGDGGALATLSAATKNGPRPQWPSPCSQETRGYMHMTALKLRVIRLTRLSRDAYEQLRDDYAQSARGSIWRALFVVVIGSVVAGTILGLIMSALWRFVASAL